jgi:hypothetical protein
MIHSYRVIVLVLLIVITTSANSFAYIPPVNEFTAAASLSYYIYDEPDVMKIKGLLYGISGSYTYTYKEALMLRVDGNFNYGSMKYTSVDSGDDSGIPDYLMEFRFLMGPDLFPMNKLMITPYIGVGYRYLHDDSSGHLTSSGYAGLLRVSNYYYLPIGISATTDYIKGWVFSLLAEYDYLGRGRQKSYTSETGSSFDVVNYQIYGYGMKFSLSCRKRVGKLDYLIEPFITYWDIGRSEDVLEPDNFLYYEPANNTVQYGLNMGVQF